MEPEEITPHPDFVRGFNEGYLLSKHQPELATKLASALGDSERAKGFQGGQKEHKDELAKNKYPGWLTRDRTKEFEEQKQKSKDDKEKDKD